MNLKWQRSLLVLLAVVWGSGQAWSQVAPARPAPSTSITTVQPAVVSAPAARHFTTFALMAVRRAHADWPRFTRVGELLAQRYLKGGNLGAMGSGQGLPEELTGRSGGLVSFGWDRAWKKDRTGEEKKHDVAFWGFDRAPHADEVARLREQKAAGVLILGFGPRGLKELDPYREAADEWFDTGYDESYRVVTLPGQPAPGVAYAGHPHLLINMINAWCVQAEMVSALTRAGKLPAMWKSYMYPDGREWGDKYFLKQQFHDDYKVAPIAAGVLATAFLRNMEGNIEWFQATQGEAVAKAAREIAAELRAGRKTVVATSGHAPYTYVGRYEDKLWTQPIDLHGTVPFQVEAYDKQSPAKALVLRVGYSGVHKEEVALFKKKEQRVLMITTPSPLPEAATPAGYPVLMDMGFSYGDAAVSIPNYPIRILPPSGIMQIVAYEAVNVEVLSRLATAPKM